MTTGITIWTIHTYLFIKTIFSRFISIFVRTTYISTSIVQGTSGFIDRFNDLGVVINRAMHIPRGNLKALPRYIYNLVGEGM